MNEYEIIEGKTVMDGKLGLRVFAPDLKDIADFIVRERIADVSVETMDPVALYRWSRTHEEQVFRKMNDASVDLSPLAQCPHIVRLNLAGDLVNSDVLKRLTNLRSLSIDNEGRKNPVDLSGMDSLETLYITKPAKNICGIFACTGLREVKFWKYAPKSRDLSEFAPLKNLENLCLVQPRIDTLDGIEALTVLRNFEVWYSRTLCDISALDRRPQIENVVLEHVPKIKPPSKNDVAW